MTTDKKKAIKKLAKAEKNFAALVIFIDNTLIKDGIADKYGTALWAAIVETSKQLRKFNEQLHETPLL